MEKRIAIRTWMASNEWINAGYSEGHSPNLDWKIGPCFAQFFMFIVHSSNLYLKRWNNRSLQLLYKKSYLESNSMPIKFRHVYGFCKHPKYVMHRLHQSPTNFHTTPINSLDQLLFGHLHSVHLLMWTCIHFTNSPNILKFISMVVLSLLCRAPVTQTDECTWRTSGTSWRCLQGPYKLQS